MLENDAENGNISAAQQNFVTDSVDRRRQNILSEEDMYIYTPFISGSSAVIEQIWFIGKTFEVVAVKTRPLRSLSLC